MHRYVRAMGSIFRSSFTNKAEIFVIVVPYTDRPLTKARP